MKRVKAIAQACGFAAALLATPGHTQVERIELDIAGYLCGF